MILGNLYVFDACGRHADSDIKYIATDFSLRFRHVFFKHNGHASVATRRHHPARKPASAFMLRDFSASLLLS